MTTTLKPGSRVGRRHRGGRKLMVVIQPIRATAVHQHVIRPFTIDQVDHLRAVLDRNS